MRKAFQILSGLVLMAFLFVLPLIARDSNGASVNEPSVVAAVAPEFPLIARSAHAQGEVVVEVTLASDGTVETSKSLSGHPLLQRAAETAAKKWKFALANDRSDKVRLVFSFGYTEGKKSDPEFLITFIPPYKVEVILNSSRVPIIDENAFVIEGAHPTNRWGGAAVALFASSLVRRGLNEIAPPGQLKRYAATSFQETIRSHGLRASRRVSFVRRMPQSKVA